MEFYNNDDVCEKIGKYLYSKNWDWWTEPEKQMRGAVAISLVRAYPFTIKVIN